MCDLYKNFSFLVQDEIQSFHWENKQATVHPHLFVIMIQIIKLNQNAEVSVSSVKFMYLAHITAVVISELFD